MSILFRPSLDEPVYSSQMVTETAAEIDASRVALGGRLAAARSKKDFSQAAVAELFSVNKATVSAWETGRGVPDALRLHRLANLYGLTANDLLGVTSGPAVDAWPFGSEITPAQYARLPADTRQSAIDMLAAAVKRQDAAGEIAEPAQRRSNGV